MKWGSLLFVLISCLSGRLDVFSQSGMAIPGNERALPGAGYPVTCAAHWKKGEKKIFSILQSRHNQETGRAPSFFRLLYEAHVTVLDSTAAGYTLQWVFQLPPEFKQAYPLAGDSLPVYDGLKMIYRTDPQGAFMELLNWVEVRDAYVRLIRMSVPGRPDDSVQKILNQTGQLFGSREAVESNLIKEIKLYHLPYGHQVSMQTSQASAKLTNPWADTPLSAIQYWTITDLEPANLYYTLALTEAADSGNKQIILSTLLRQLPATAPGRGQLSVAPHSSYSALKQALAQFSIRDNSEYRVYSSTGWITIVRSTHTMQVDGLHEEDQFEIILTE